MQVLPVKAAIGLALLGFALFFAVSVHACGWESALWGWATLFGFAATATAFSIIVFKAGL
jgi:hypothetical protein